MVGVAKLQWTELTRLDVEAREYTAHYLVTDVDPASGEGPTSVILASGLPQPGAVYTNGTEYDYFAVCTGYGRIAPLDWKSDRQTYSVVVNYSTDANKQRRPANDHTNPLNKPPIISGGGFKSRRAAHDVQRNGFGDGNAVINKARGDFPDREVLVDQSSTVIRITKNYSSIDLGILEDYTDSVNQGAWMDKPARTWKMEPPQWQKVYYVNTPYYEVTYEFHGNDDTWDLKPRNMGKKDIDGKMAELDGVKINDFVDLDIDGNFVTGAGAFGVDNLLSIKFDGLGPNPDPFRWYKERDFTALGLPSTP